jgi:hypothetical protein
VTDEISPKADDAPLPQLRALVTPADFDTVDFEAPIRSLDICDPQDFSTAYEQAFGAARKAGDEPAQVVYRLLYHLCSIMLHVSDSANVWGPFGSGPNGRTAIPEDFRGEQTATFAAIVPRIVNPGLRARIADIAWSNNRRDGASAAAAIEAYCESVEGLLSGQWKTRYDRNPTAAALPFVQRALQIANATTKRTKRPARLLTMFESIYNATRDPPDIATFTSLADLALAFGLRQPNAVAPELEAAAGAISIGTYPMAVKRAWDLAARLYNNLGDKDARRRCLIGAVEQTLAMRNDVKGSAGAEASWVMDALQQLRHIDGMEDRERELEIELRRLQKASLKQMGSFEFDLKIGDTPQKVAEHFAALSLSDSLKQFALLDHSRDPAKLRAEALEVAKASPLMAMMPWVHVDDEGRTTSRSAGAPFDGEPDETWFRRMIGESERIRRARIVSAAIDPARVAIHARFGIAERHFNAIVGLSGFVPDEQKPILALGFVRFFQGDFMSATHLLIPQLEAALRHLLKKNGHDPGKRRDDATEEDLSLSGLFLRFRPDLDKILTPALASEIDLLFNARPGPALRHELAHGQISAGACFHPDVYYANWLIYRLACLLILPGWDAVVTPQLAAEE